MKWQPIENKIKSALADHRSEVDPAEIWGAIEPQVDALNKRRKRRRFFLLFFLVGLLITGSGLAYFYQTENGSTEEPLSEMPVVIKADQASTPSKMSPLQPATSSGVPPIEAADPKAEKGVTPAGQPIVPVPIFIPDKTREATPVPENLHPQAAISTPAEILPPRTGIPQEIAPPDLSPLSLSGSNFGGSLPEQLHLTGTSLMAPPLRRNKLWLSAGVQGSISFVERKLEADSAAQELAGLRKRSERSLEALQAGIRLSVHHRSGFGITSGLNYTQINERFRYHTSVSSMDSVYGIQYYIITINNDTVPYYGDVPVERKTTYKKTYYNKYRMLEVPLLGGYRFEGRGFSAGVQAGVFVNLNLKTAGRILAAEDAFENLSDTEVFRSSMGVSYYAGLSAGYRLRENIELTIAPFVRHFPRSFTDSSYGISQRYNLYGVNIGAVYHFY